MKKHKLSSTQIWVIEKMQKGEILHLTSGMNPKLFFDMKTPISWATIYKLENLGIVFRGQGKIELTEIGKSISLTTPNKGE